MDDDNQPEIAALLIHAADACKASFAEAVEPHGLTHTQARALFALQREQPMSALADQLSCDASNVTLIADQLESLGLVARNPGTDRRVKLLTLTAEGEEKRLAVGASVAAQPFPFQRLGRKDRATLQRLLRTITSAD